MQSRSPVKVGLAIGLVYGVVRHPGALLVLLLLLGLLGAILAYGVYSWLAGYIGPGGIAAAVIGLMLRRIFVTGRKRGGPPGPDQAPPK